MITKTLLTFDALTQEAQHNAFNNFIASGGHDADGAELNGILKQVLKEKGLPAEEIAYSIRDCRAQGIGIYGKTRVTAKLLQNASVSPEIIAKLMTTAPIFLELSHKTGMPAHYDSAETIEALLEYDYNAGIHDIANMAREDITHMARELSKELGRFVYDYTDITGSYDFVAQELTKRGAVFTESGELN